jgi:hypothetical protein
MNQQDSRPYKATLQISFPFPAHAAMAMKTLSVDEEISGDKVAKTFSLEQGDGEEEACVLCAHIEASEAKLLRVSVSSFYDMLTVSLKCFQEFS